MLSAALGSATADLAAAAAGDQPVIHYGEPVSAVGPGAPLVGDTVRVTGWTLLRADTGDPVATFGHGAVINLRELPTRALNVRADVAGDVSGVRFGLNGDKDFRSDTAGPVFTLNGDGTAGGQSWPPAPGVYSVAATPLLAGGGQGGRLAGDVEFIDEPPALAGRLGTSAQSVDFGETPVGGAATRQVTLTNLGTSGDPSISVSGVSLSGTNAADFTEDFGSSVNLAPGQSVTLTLTFTPAAEGTRAGSLSVTHTGVNSPLSLALTGSGKAVAAPADGRPAIVSTDPAESATGVRRDKAIQVRLRLPNGGIDPASVDDNTVRLVGPGGATIPVNVRLIGETVRVEPTAVLAANAQYTLEITEGVRDRSGAPVHGATVRFTTGESYLPAESRREVVDLDASWKFIRNDVAGAQAVNFNDAAWTTLSLPHTWNAQDGQDGGDDFYQGATWYRKHVTPEASFDGKELFLRFDGSFLVTEVFVNGTSVGEHRGGFAAFTFDVTDHLRPGRDNVIAVRVDNRNNDDVAPLDRTDVIAEGPDFTFFGGLYRGVDLIATDPVHVTLTDFSSPGVYLKQSNVSQAAATVQVLTKVRNGSSAPRTIAVKADVVDAGGQVVKTVTGSQLVAAGATVNVTQSTTIENPHLWNGTSDPYLYDVHVYVLDGSTTLDHVTQPLGLRSFRVDPDDGFILNGQPYDLHGAAYHQDRVNKGWATAEADLDEDIGLMREMGVNYTRLVHYQHAEHTYDLLDQTGIVAWTEIPYVYNANDTVAFRENIEDQLQELIRQNYNHPSVMFWGLFNGLESDPVNDALVLELHNLAHTEDPSRLTTAAMVTRAGPGARVNQITDVIGYNNYFGWYRGDFDDFGPYADDFHRRYPDRPFGVAEYGAGGSVSQHEEDPDRPDPRGDFHPEEYQAEFHEAQWPQMKARPWIWAKTAFAMFDFATDNRDEGELPGRNDKGLVTFDRLTRKDAFYFYKSNWTDTPTVYITGHRFTDRPDADADVKIYSNLDSVELKVNGVSLGAETGNDVNVFEWDGVQLRPGANTIEATGTRDGQTVTDTVTWNV